MKLNRPFKTFLPFAAIAGLALTTLAHAAVVYLEDFNVNPGVKDKLSTAGWTAVQNNGTTLTDEVNRIDSGSDVEGGNRIFTRGTTWYVSDAPALATITQVRWLDRQSGVGYRLGLEVGGTWYLSDSLSTSPGGGFDPGDGAHPGITITDFSSFAAWGAGTASTGAPADDTEAFDLSTLGTAGVLPSGNITRIGLYGTGGTQRFDYLEVSGTAVPAPSSAPFAITEIEYDPDADPVPTVTLTWRKTSAATYIAWLSRDLSDWGEDLDDSITAADDGRPEDTEHITVTFPLEGDRADAEELFFRIEEG